MKYLIFTQDQKDYISSLFIDFPMPIIWQFIAIKNNLWVLPETVLNDQDVLNHIPNYQAILNDIEIRPVYPQEQINIFEP